MTLTDELRRLVGTPEMEPVLWKLEERQLANPSRQAIYVRDAKKDKRPFLSSSIKGPSQY